MKANYKLLFENMSMDKGWDCISIKETKNYIYLVKPKSTLDCVYRVSKKTMKVRYLDKLGSNFGFDMPKAIMLVSIN
jgi:hypothetical protein